MTSEQNINPDWKHFTSVANGLVNVCGACPGLSYVSLALPAAADGGALLVRRVVFTTVSHDQGWVDADSNSKRGTYEASHTTFQARVLEPSGHERVPLRHLQSNVIAQSEFKTHVNCWDYHDQTHAKFLADIKEGDKIQILPKAWFAGWNNYVREARIDVWAEAVVASAPWSGVPTTIDYSIYKKLHHEEKEIRVVVIEPGTSDRDEPVRLSLRATSLADANHLLYEALSYCWGDVYDPQMAILTDPLESQSDTQISITSNLLAALKRLRCLDTPRTLWIDLLCINQHDPEERNLQVALMGEIFALAVSVYVWLGELDGGVQEDFKVIRSITQKYIYALSDVPSNARKQGQVETEPEASLPSTRKTHRLVTDLDYYTDSNNLLFQRPWFQRVWVVQEVWITPSGFTDQEGTAKNRVIVLSGNEELPWDAVLQANPCLKMKFPWYNRKIMPGLWTALFKVSRDTKQHRLARTSRRSLDILTAVIGGLDMKASNPRDKIFSLLVFGQETHQIAELPDLIRPDYKKTILQVYVDFTHWWIKHHRSLRILSAIHTLTGRTWLDLSGPNSSEDDRFDLAQRPSWILWYDGRSEWMRCTLALNEPCEYSACGDCGVDVASTSSSNTLALKGIPISTVTSISYYPYLAEPQYPDMGRAYERIFDPTAGLNTWNSGKWGFDIEPPTLNNIKRESERHWGEHLPQMRESEVGPWLPCHGKCMFEAADGKIGLCPSGTRVGDLVVILFGGKVPYLLRHKNAEEYYFVGECYVEKLMKGEAVPLERKTSVEQTFFLV